MILLAKGATAILHSSVWASALATTHGTRFLVTFNGPTSQEVALPVTGLKLAKFEIACEFFVQYDPCYVDTYRERAYF